MLSLSGTAITVMNETEEARQTLRLPERRGVLLLLLIKVTLMLKVVAASVIKYEHIMFTLHVYDLTFMSGGGRDEGGVTGDLSSRRLFNIFKRNSAFVGKFGIFYTGSQDVCSRCLKQRDLMFLMRPRSSPAVFVVTKAGVSFKETLGQMHTYIYWCHVGFE